MTKLKTSYWPFCSAMIAVILVTVSTVSLTHAQQVDEQFGLAAGHYERQEYEQAVESFRDLIANFPDSSQASLSHFYLAESLVQQLNYQAAYPAYQLFLKSNPDHSLAKRARFRMAEAAFRLNWDEQATNQLEKFVAKYSDDSLCEFALSFLGELRLRRNEPQLAQRVFETAIQRYPYSSHSHRNRFGLAKALQQQGNAEEALRFYQMLTSGGSNPMYVKAMLQIGIIHFSNGNYELAQTAMLHVLDHVDDAADKNEAVYWLARTNLAQGNNQTAFEYYLQIVDKPFSGDTQASVLFDAAIAASRTNELEQSIDWLNRLQTTWPKSSWADDATQLKIELLYRQKKHHQAAREIANFRSQFADHPNLSTIGEYEGRIYYDQGKYDQTIETFQQLLEKFGSDPAHQDKRDRWKYFLGLGHLGNRDFVAAAKQFAAIDIKEASSEFHGSVLLAQSSAAVGLDQEQQAVAFLEKFMATIPTGNRADRARSDLAIAYAKLNRWDQAKQILLDLENHHSQLDVVLETRLLLAEYALVAKQFAYSEACFAGLTDSSYPRKYIVRGLSGLAWVRMSRGQQDSSVEVFRKIIREHGESDFAAESAMACGRFFEQNADFEGARKMYDLILEQYAESDFVQLATLRRAYCLHQVGGDENLALAKREMQQYIVKNKQFIDEAQYQLAWLYIDAGNEDNAMNHFWEIATNHPKSKFWSDSALRVAQWQLKEKNFEKARQLAQQLLSCDEPIEEIKIRCHFLIGQIAVHEQNWSEVETRMRSVLSETDDESLRKKTRYWLAESMFQQGRYDEALVDLNRLAGNPDLTTDTRQAWVQLRRAQTLAYLNKWTQALDEAIAGKSNYPDFDAIYEFDFVCGRAHSAQGRLADARTSYLLVIDSPTGRMTQTAAMAQWRIGQTFFHQQDYESAIKAFFKVDSLYAYEKWRAAALIEAGKCQEHLGNWKHAMKLYQQLIEKFPNSEFRIAAEDRLGTATRQAAREKSSIK